MTTILYRIDPTHNMRRFYRLDVQRDLFGQWCLMREWGRIGRAGRMAVAAYGTPDEANRVLSKIQRIKSKRGYATVR